MDFETEYSKYKSLVEVDKKNYVGRVNELEKLYINSQKIQDLHDRATAQNTIKNQLMLVKKDEADEEIMTLIGQVVDGKYKKLLIPEYSIDISKFNDLKTTLDSLYKNTEYTPFKKYSELMTFTNRLLTKALEISTRDNFDIELFNTIVSMTIEAEKVEQFFASTEIRTLKTSQTLVIKIEKEKDKSRNETIDKIELNLLKKKLQQCLQENNQNEGGNTGNNGRGGTKMPAQRQLLDPLTVQTPSKPIVGNFTQQLTDSGNQTKNKTIYQ